MKLTIQVHQKHEKPRQRLKIFTTAVDDLTLADLRRLWDAEQVINTIPGSSLKVHFDVTTSRNDAP